MSNKKLIGYLIDINDINVKEIARELRIAIENNKIDDLEIDIFKEIYEKYNPKDVDKIEREFEKKLSELKQNATFSYKIKLGDGRFYESGEEDDFSLWSIVELAIIIWISWWFVRPVFSWVIGQVTPLFRIIVNHPN